MPDRSALPDDKEAIQDCLPPCGIGIKPIELVMIDGFQQAPNDLKEEVQAAARVRSHE